MNRLSQNTKLCKESILKSSNFKTQKSTNLEFYTNQLEKSKKVASEFEVNKSKSIKEKIERGIKYQEIVSELCNEIVNLQDSELTKEVQLAKLKSTLENYDLSNIQRSTFQDKDN